MSLDDKIKSTAKDAEGKLQEAAGKLTGDKQMQAEGEIKQVQASAMDAVGNIKDQASNLLDGIKEGTNNLINNIKNKLD